LKLDDYGPKRGTSFIDELGALGVHCMNLAQCKAQSVIFV